MLTAAPCGEPWIRFLPTTPTSAWRCRLRPVSASRVGPRRLPPHPTWAMDQPSASHELRARCAAWAGIQCHSGELFLAATSERVTSWHALVKE